MAKYDVTVSTDSEPGLFEFEVPSSGIDKDDKVNIARECRNRLNNLFKEQGSEGIKLVFERWDKYEGKMITTIETAEGPFYVEAQAA